MLNHKLQWVIWLSKEIQAELKDCRHNIKVLPVHEQTTQSIAICISVPALTQMKTKYKLEYISSCLFYKTFWQELNLSTYRSTPPVGHHFDTLMQGVLSSMDYLLRFKVVRILWSVFTVLALVQFQFKRILEIRSLLVGRKHSRNLMLSRIICACYVSTIKDVFSEQNKRD